LIALLQEAYMMKTRLLLLSLALSVSPAAFGAGAKTYQVTGPVLEISADTIVVQKGQDRWEIARDASTKAPTGLKVGDKVTIEYRMTATSVEVKPEKPASKAPKK
jgi:hypothetical protein